MIEFEKMLDGLIKYIDEKFIVNMNNLQEIGVRIILGEVYDNRGKIKELLLNNGIVKTFGYIDNEGNIDIEKLMNRLKKEIQNKGKLEITVPMYGKMIFTPEDVDEIYNYIRGV